MSETRTTIRSLWDFSDPAESETRFRNEAEAAGARGEEAWRQCLLTQAARTLGLRGEFESALALLDEIRQTLEGLDADTDTGTDLAELRVRCELERGRVHRSAGRVEDSRPHFEQAFEKGRSAGLDDLTIDAAHMMAIITKGDEALQWFKEGVEQAQQTDDPDAAKWLGPLYNNYGWTLHDAGRYSEALSVFEQSLDYREGQGNAETIRIARYCVAKTLRSLERLDEALEMNIGLLAQMKEADVEDGYVSEEAGECLLALGREEEAGPHFAEAHRLLSADQWLRKNEAERLVRLARLGGVEESP